MQSQPQSQPQYQSAEQIAEKFRGLYRQSVYHVHTIYQAKNEAYTAVAENIALAMLVEAINAGLPRLSEVKLNQGVISYHHENRQARLNWSQAAKTPRQASLYMLLYL